jgi:ribosomal protein S18 acetylase RimI-like enzyme
MAKQADADGLELLGRISVREATEGDLEDLLPRTRALNAHEGIAISDARLRSALQTLLASPELGSVWVITRDGDPVGYAMATYGFDLEFDGRDAHLTELWIDPPYRGGGSAATALDLLMTELAARGVNAVHLQVRLDNPALRLYERRGFVLSSRRIMTRVLSRR